MPLHHTIRTSALLGLAALFMASGCILVVEEDDFGYGHGGGYGFHGTSWTLELFFFGGRSHHVRDRGYGVHFREAGALSGSVGCGAFEANYSADDSRLTIERNRGQSFSCSDDPVAEIFLDEFNGSFDYTIDGDELQISGRGGTELVFRR